MFLSAPPQTPVALPHILRIKAGQTLTVRLAGAPLRTATHYFRSRTQPCIKAALGTCPLCDNVANPRYYAYWPCRGKTGTAGAVELTQFAEQELMAILPTECFAIGTLVTFSRPSGRRNNPIEVSIPNALPQNELLRQDQTEAVPLDSIQQTLFRLWECPERGMAEPMDVYLQRACNVMLARYTGLCTPGHTSSNPRD